LQDDILTEAHVQAPQLVRLAKTLGVPDLRGLLDASQD
jgi:hypothetical protein